MKNQYFGDTRDLLKFSFLLALAERIPTVERLSCIWLLTPPVPNNDGNRHFRDVTEGTELAAFLHRCVTTGRRDVREFASHMARRPVRYLSYGDCPDMHFTEKSRSDYFAAIPDECLHRAVVFFDPDNGIEPASTGTSAHVRLTELGSVLERMDIQSLAVIYQHLPRRKPSLFWPALAARVRSALNCAVGYVACGDIGFILAVRDAAAPSITAAITAFQDEWPKQLLIDVPR